MSPVNVRDALRSATADLRITDHEWHTVLQPAVDAQPLRATAETRRVLDTFVRSDVAMDPEARRHLRDYLLSRGYAVPGSRPAGMSDAQVARGIAASNVGEVDETFARLTRLTGRTGAEVNVGVVDNGFDLFHPELGRKGFQRATEVPSNGVDDDRNGKIDDSHGWDWVDWNNDVGHPHGDWHGTHVAGIATRGTDQVNLIPLRVLDAPYDVHRVADAIDYAVANGARVINLSFGVDTPERVRVMTEVLERHPGVLFVAAVGNDDRSLDGFDPGSFLPAARFPNLVSVAAADAGGGKAGFSNYGRNVTVAARGAGVYSTAPGARYELMDGTSMAAPQITNLAAKAMVLDPTLDAAKARQLLIATSDVRADWAGKNEAGGIVNETRAMQLAALRTLTRGGLSASAALNRLGVHGVERQRLSTALNALRPQ